MVKLCCTCKTNPRRKNQRDCTACHAATMRVYRIRRSIELQRMRAELKHWRERQHG